MHLPIFHRTTAADQKQGLRTALYVSIFIRSIAGSLIHIFVPIYLYQLGFGLRGVALFYLIVSVTIPLVFSLGLYLTARGGTKISMTVGTFFEIAYLYMLGSITSVPGIAFIAVLWSISVGLYWSGYHIFFLTSRKISSQGAYIALTKLTSAAASIMGPLVGAVIIFIASFNDLFLTTALLLLGSLIPLILTRNNKVSFTMPRMSTILHADTGPKAASYVADGALDYISAAFWPVFMFLYLMNVISIGAIESGAVLFTAAAVLLFGRLADRDKQSAIRYSVFLQAPTWILRLILTAPWGIFLMNLISKATKSMLDTAFTYYLYSETPPGKQTVPYLLFHELYISAGRLGVALFVFFTSNLTALFIAAFFLTFTYLFLLSSRHVPFKHAAP